MLSWAEYKFFQDSVKIRFFSCVCEYWCVLQAWNAAVILPLFILPTTGTTTLSLTPPDACAGFYIVPGWAEKNPPQGFHHDIISTFIPETEMEKNFWFYSFELEITSKSHLWNT